MPSATVDHILRKAKQQLSKTSQSPALDSEVLFRHITNYSTIDLIRESGSIVSSEHESHFWQLILEREKGKPVAYLIGKREFWSLDFAVNESTLIPRPDTETLLEQAVKITQKHPHCNILDLGTGSGNIAISIAHECPTANVTGIDISPNALDIAQQNAIRLNIKNVTFLLSNWFNKLTTERFDLITSNPPYIAKDDEHLTLGDVRFEPRSALVSGDQGLDDIEHIAQCSVKYLEKNGQILIEHGATQGASVRSILHSAGFSRCETFKDLSNNERVSKAQLLLDDT